MPVAIFSHGLRGHGNCMSNLCRMMASRGFLTLSYDHNDGSAAITNEDPLYPDVCDDQVLDAYNDPDTAHLFHKQ